MPIKILTPTGDQGSEPTAQTPEAAAAQTVPSTFAAAPGKYATPGAKAPLSEVIPAAQRAATDAIPTAAGLAASAALPEISGPMWLYRIGAAAVAGGAAEPLRRAANRLMGIQTELDQKPLAEGIKEQATRQAELQVFNEGLAAVMKPIANLAIAGVNRFIKPLGNAMDDEANKAILSTAETYLGRKLTAGEISNNPALKAVQQVMERRAASNPLAKQRDLQLYQMGTQAINDALDRIGPPPPMSPLGETASTGQVVQNAFKAADDAWSEARRRMWYSIKVKGQDVPVDISPVRDLAKDILTPQTEAQAAFSSLLSPGKPVKKALGQLGQEAQAQLNYALDGLGPGAREQVMAELQKAGQGGVTKVNLPDAIDMNSALQDAMRKLDPHSKDFQRIASVQGAMYKSMEDATKAAGLYDDWRAAADYTRDGHALFQSSVLRNAARQNPEAVAAGLDLKSPSDILNARTAIVDHAGDTDAWKIVKRQIIKDQLIGKVAKDGSVDLAGIGARMRSADPAALKLLVDSDPETTAAVNNIKSISDAFERKTKPPTATMPAYQTSSDVNQAVNLIAQSAMGYKVGLPVKLAARLVPEGILKALYSEKATGYLLDGISILGRQPQLPGLTTKGISQIARAFEVLHDAIPEDERKRNQSVSAPTGGIRILPMEQQNAPTP